MLIFDPPFRIISYYNDLFGSCLCTYTVFTTISQLDLVLANTLSLNPKICSIIQLRCILSTIHFCLVCITQEYIKKLTGYFLSSLSLSGDANATLLSEALKVPTGLK